MAAGLAELMAALKVVLKAVQMVCGTVASKADSRVVLTVLQLVDKMVALKGRMKAGKMAGKTEKLKVDLWAEPKA